MLVAIGVHSSSCREQRPGCARHAVERGSAGAGQTAANAAPLLSGRERAGALPSRAPDLRASIVEACNGSVVLIQWTLLFNALAHQPTTVPACILASHQLHYPRFQLLTARRRAEIVGGTRAAAAGAATVSGDSVEEKTLPAPRCRLGYLRGTLRRRHDTVRHSGRIGVLPAPHVKSPLNPLTLPIPIICPVSA